MITIALIAGFYALLLPSLNLTSSQVSDSLSLLSQDIRGAFDTAVLDGKVHRLVFDIKKNQYWLEKTEQKSVSLKSSQRVSMFKEEETKEEIEAQFVEYGKLSGEEILDPETDKMIKSTSPILAGKKHFFATKWSVVKTSEWNKRYIADNLFIRSIFTESLEEPLTYQQDEEEQIGFIYIFPSGYIEKSLLQIYYKGSDGTPEEGKEPYTLVVDSFKGIGRIIDGAKSWEEIEKQEDQL
jgi:hypothetical protein